MHRPIYAGQSSKIASTTTISSYSRPQTSDEGVGKATGSDNHVGRSQSTTDKGEEGDEQSTWETATNLASQAAAQTVESMKMIAVAASHAIARGAISEDEEDKLGSAEHSPEKTEYKPRPVIKTPPHEDAAPAAKVVHPNRSTVKVPQKTTVVVNDKNLHPHTPTTTGPPSWPRQQPVQVTRVTKTTRVAKAPGARIAPRTPHQQQNEKGKDEVEEQSMVGSPMTQRRGHKAPEDWISILIEVLWPKIRKVTEDIAWEQVPRKFN